MISDHVYTYTREQLLALRDSPLVTAPENLEEIKLILQASKPRTDSTATNGRQQASRKFKNKKEIIETDVTGFQSVRRGQNRHNNNQERTSISEEGGQIPATLGQKVPEWLESEDISVPKPNHDDGMDDIQRFRQRMKEQEVIVKGTTLKVAPVAIQSANIFDVLEQLESTASMDEIFTTSDTGKKSKFDKIFNASQQAPDESVEYNKVVDMLANSLKLNGQQLPPQQYNTPQYAQQPQQQKKSDLNDDEDNHLSALLNSSIKGKKNMGQQSASGPRH